MLRSYRKASFTVEASLLMPLVLLVIFAVLYLDFHVQNRNVILASACENAITGHDRDPLVLMGTEGADKTLEDDGKKRTVSYSLVTSSVYGGYAWEAASSAEYVICDPVSLIREARTLKMITGTGESG